MPSDTQPSTHTCLLLHMLQSCFCCSHLQPNMTFLSFLWIQVTFILGTHFSEGTNDYPSREDRLLLEEEETPKCFTRTEEDFTCFWETDHNNTYDVFYNFDSTSAMERCKTSTWRTEDETFLHVCVFPASDVHSFVDTNIKVMDSNTNQTIYSRSVSVEDHFLLDQPFNVTLHPTDHVGQLRVSWQQFVPRYWGDRVRFRIRHLSKGLGEKMKEGSRRSDDTVITLQPGDEVQVQVSVKCGHNKKAGHWSSWSSAVQAVAPQSGDDISLVCFTVDLQMITCQWSSSGFRNKSQMFHKMLLSETTSWTDWTECSPESLSADSCTFNASQSTKVKVRVLTDMNSFGQTFYTPDFSVQSSIKVWPPALVKGSIEEEKLCLEWNAPVLSVPAPLLYEAAHQTRGQEVWTISSLMGPSTEMCLEVPAGTHYRARVRAKVEGSMFSGHWSDWSDELSGDTPAGTDAVVLMCIPVVLLVAVLLLFTLFPSYLNKLKEHLWPPVPDLDKVLQSFLAEMDNHKWELPVTVKQCTEEMSPSVVEVMSREEPSEPVLASEHLLPPDDVFSSREQLHTSSVDRLLPEYVTLNRSSLGLLPVGNKYVLEKSGEKRGAERPDERLKSPDTCGNFLNFSYVAPAEAAGGLRSSDTTESGNLYTNL